MSHFLCQNAMHGTYSGKSVHVKYLCEKWFCKKRFWCKLQDFTVLHRQTIHWTVNKLWQRQWSLLDRNWIQIFKCSLKRYWMKSNSSYLAQETGVSKSSARSGTELLKLKPFKITVVHELQPHDSANRVNFCN